MSEEKSTEKERKGERKLVELSSTSSSDDVRYSSVSLSSSKSVIKEEIRNLGGKGSKRIKPEKVCSSESESHKEEESSDSVQIVSRN